MNDELRVVLTEDELEELLDEARRAERQRAVRIVIEEIDGEMCGIICAEIDGQE